MSMRSWRWTSLRLPRKPRIAARVLLKRANLSFVCPYVRYDRCMRLPAFFSCFFCQPFFYSVAFWCHPSSCCEDKGIEWRLLYVNHSLIVFIFLFLFMLLVDLCQGLPRIWLWGRMCDPYVKESFLTPIPQSSRRDIQPCIVSSVDFSVIIIFIAFTLDAAIP